MITKRKRFLLVGVLVLLLVGAFIFIRGDIFSEKEEFVIPEKYQEYSDENFYFKYQGTEVIKFDDDGEHIGTIRIKVTDKIQINLEHMVGYTESPYEMAQELDSYGDNHMYKKSPREIPNENLKGYYGTRFVQNIEFSVLNDYAIFDTPKGIFKLSMGLTGEDQELYSQGHQVFLLILNTLEVKP